MKALQRDTELCALVALDSVLSLARSVLIATDSGVEEPVVDPCRELVDTIDLLASRIEGYLNPAAVRWHHDDGRLPF